MTNILDKKSLAVFVCAGDPDIKTSGKIALEAVLAGADLLQIGIPFSDPVAEDPIIQSATARALKIGVKVDEIFEMVNSLQAKTDVPVLFSVYLNTVFKYGYEEFFKNCAKSNVVGVKIGRASCRERVSSPV